MFGECSSEQETPCIPSPFPHLPSEIFAYEASFPIAIRRLLLCSLQIYIREAKFTKACTRGITAAQASKKFVSFVSSFYSNRLDRIPTAPQPYQLPCLSWIFRQHRRVGEHLLLLAVSSSHTQSDYISYELFPMCTFSHCVLMEIYDIGISLYAFKDDN